MTRLPPVKSPLRSNVANTRRGQRPPTAGNHSPTHAHHDLRLSQAGFHGVSVEPGPAQTAVTALREGELPRGQQSRALDETASTPRTRVKRRASVLLRLCQEQPDQYPISLPGRAAAARPGNRLSA